MSHPLKIWFVDDMASNRQMWLNSFSDDIKSKHEFTTFDSVDAVLKAGQENCPDVLFIDYYLGERRGTEVIEFWLKQPQRPVLVAHSSMLNANQHMLALGADLMISKNPGQDSNSAIQRRIQSEADLQTLAKMGGTL